MSNQQEEEEQHQPQRDLSVSQSIHSAPSISRSGNIPVTRSQRRSEVRGPTSALTSFLYEHGISAREIARRHDQFLQRREAMAASTAENETGLATEVTVIVRRKRHIPSDFEDEDEDDDGDKKDPKNMVPEASSSTPLCNRCRRPLSEKLTCSCSKPRKGNRKKPPPDWTTNRTTHTLLPSLQDLCVRTLVEYLDAIEHLGGLPDTSRIKLASALSRRRMVTPAVLPIFLAPHLTTLTLFDVAQLTSEHLSMLPVLTPLLRTLHLGFCGRANDAVLESWTSWMYLTEIILSGAYLIRDSAWASFFQLRGGVLTKLNLTYPSKLSELGIQSLIKAQKAHGSPLEELSLVHGDALTSNCFSWISHLRLVSLDIRHSCSQLTPALLSACLSPTTHSLAISQCDWDKLEFSKNLRLTHLTLLDIYAKHATNVVWPFQELVMDRCSFTPLPWLRASLNTLTLLSIQAAELTDNLVETLAKCVQLRSLDVSWIREVNDTHLERWVSHQLNTLTIFGCHLVSPMLLQRGLCNGLGSKVTLIGSEYTF